ncbi:unnamed protein product [Cyclocybe aegerita]|uniref:Uncharacterized protein n=1 Tax=Cyclocybe aegerita TaxID=1973307 RepID=A0A8S0VRZ6_CYCAE|nr:unnamed protein product [Cyclocybe aegerita]
MAALFWRQFCALFIKNALVFRKHWLANLLRCLLFPIGYGIFLGYTPNFFATPDQYGLGTIVPIFRLEHQFDGSRPLVWVDNTDRNGFISAQGIMNQVSANFNEKQHSALKEVTSSSS